jgi:hypothetical protein
MFIAYPSDKGESLEHLNTSLYRVNNKYGPPSDKGESLEHVNTSLCLRVVYVYCILCKVRCLGVLVIPLCLRMVYVYCILFKVRCLGVLVIPLTTLRQRGITRTRKHLTLQCIQ